MSPLPSVSETLKSGRDGFLAVRFVLAGAVLVSHALLIANGPAYQEPLARWTGLDLGQHAVNMFFAISGFLVVQSLERRDLASYASARMLRLLPGLAVAAGVTALLIGPLATNLPLAAYLREANILSFIGHVLVADGHARLQGIFPHNPDPDIMPTVWTLKYEVICYVLLISVACGPRWSRRLAAGILLLGSTAVLLTTSSHHFPSPVESLCRFIVCFMIGVGMWRFRARVPLDLRVVLGLGALAVLLAHTSGGKIMIMAFESYAVLWAALVPLLSARLAPATDLSFGIYLYGFPIEQAVWHWTGPIGPWPLLLIAAPLTLLAASLSWRLVERPALALKTGRARARRPVAEAELATPP